MKKLAHPFFSSTVELIPQGAVGSVRAETTGHFFFFFFFFRNLSEMSLWWSSSASPNFVPVRRQIWPPSAILDFPNIASPP